MIDLSSNKKLNLMLNNVIKEINTFSKRQFRHIDRLTEIGLSLSSKKELDDIFDMILQESLFFTNADGATIYTLSENKKYLNFEVVYNRTLNINLSRLKGNLNWEPIPLYDENGFPLMKTQAAYVAHTGEIKNYDDIYEQDQFETTGTKQYDKKNNYRTKSILALPLKSHENDVIGVIQLINPINEKGEIDIFSNEDIHVINSLASLAGIALNNRQLIKGLENLILQFVSSIASAIDRKSKYTGAHIQRVAEISKDLVNIIQKDNERFSQKKFTHEEIQEIGLAALMHDFGKIITPEFIMDKSTKLEAIIDKISLIEERCDFIIDIINKDKEIAKLKNKPTENLDKIISEINYFKVWIEIMNGGTEFMNDDLVRKLEEIYRFRYISNKKEYFILTDDEYEKLSVRKGTLTKDEIVRMQEHAQISYNILSSITFPKKYKNIPIYASLHHEKLNGKGYPFHYKAEQIPFQARIIAIADIFEALTATDRPYKKGKTIEETLTILAKMAKNNEIDSDILDALIDTNYIFNYFERFFHKKYRPEDIDIDSIKRIYHK